MPLRYRKLKAINPKESVVLVIHDDKTGRQRPYKFFLESEARRMGDDLVEMSPDRFKYEIKPKEMWAALQEVG